MKNLVYFSCSICALCLCCSCDPVTMAVGGTAVAGTTMTCNEEGISGSVSDTNLQVNVNNALMNAGEDIFDRVELCVKHGMVVVIGYMKDEEQRQKALDAVKGVKCYHAEIFDELKVQPQPTGSEVFADATATTRVKTAFKLDGNIMSLNYDVTTVKGIVYICGTAMSAYEKENVIEQARSISGINKVVAYIKVKKKPQSNKI